MADTTTNNYGRFADLVPNASSNGANPAPSTNKFADLIPDAGKKTRAPTTQNFGKFSDLLPKKEVKIPSGNGNGFLDTISKIIEPPKEESLGTNVTKNTLKYLPSEVARHLPFGVGAIVQSNDEPLPEVTASDVLSGVVKTAKDYAKYPVAAAVNLYPKPLKFDIPGLGEVTNRQFNAANRIANGEDPAAVTLEEGSGAIFDTLFLLGMAYKVVSPREVTVAKTTLPKESSITVKAPPKSFRAYEEPTAVAPMSSDMVTKAMTELKVPEGKYDTSLPTYFRIKGKANGVVTGEVVQIKPSYIRTFIDKLKSDYSKVSPEQVNVIATKNTDVKAFENVKPIPVNTSTAITPDITTEEINLGNGSHIVSPENITNISETTPAQPLTLKPSVAEESKPKTDTKEWTANWILNSGKSSPPSQDVISELSKFKPTEPITLYRGVKEDSPEVFRSGIQSWTKDKKIAEKFAKGLKTKGSGPGKVISKVFNPDEIVTDISNIPESYLGKEFNVPEDFRTEGEVLVKDNNSKSFSTKGNDVFASVGEFADGSPLSLGARESVKPIELPEMVRLATELMGTAPKIRTELSKSFGGQVRGTFKAQGPGEIKLRADLFDPRVTNPDQVAKVLAHEIGHLVDYLPEGTMTRGNLLGRLGTLNEFRKDFLADAGVSRTDSAIRKELYEFSKYWRPFDEATASNGFVTYRKSSKELYADFISGLFNDPVRLQQTAPEAYNAFFKMLDQKPKVRDAYFELQAALTGDRNTIIERRRFGIQKMFKEGDIKSIEYQKKLELEKKSNKITMNFIKYALVDNNTAMIDRVLKLEKNGITLNMDEDPRYLLEERNYLSGLVKNEIERFVVPVVNNLKLNDIPWDTFGEALFYERIILGDRSVQANPQGITPAAATELYNNLRAELGPQKTEVMNHEINSFRMWLQTVAERAYMEGLYTDALNKQMKENPSYVTFRVLEYIEENVTSNIYKSIGTLKDVTNPANASILKAIATIRAMERNKTIKTSVDMLTKHYPDDIEVADKRFNGRVMTFKEPRGDDTKLITFKRNGKSEGYYVDNYIADSLNNNTIGQNNAVMVLISPIGWLNRNLFKPLFIGYNPGFQAFNFIRDFKRYWKNVPDATLVGSLKEYIKAMPIAQARAFGLPEKPDARMLKAKDDLQILEKNKVFSTTFTDYNLGASTEDKEIDMILEKSGIETKNKQNRFENMSPIIDGAIKVAETLQKVGNYIETLPKAAAALRLSKGEVANLSSGEKSFIRKYVGSPDFLAKGYMSPLTNDIFLFSNAITQGMRSDAKIMIDPKTRSGYWWKTAQMTFIPKILLFMVGLGLFGKEMKKLMDGVSEYDKTNYTTIPLGSDENGKTIYMRIPEDETSRFIGGIFWKTLRAFDPSQEQPLGQQIQDVASFLGGQVPTVTPAITVPKTIAEYVSGKNPYDSFRDRNVISDNVFKAHNWETDKAFLGYIVGQMGGGIVYNFQAQGSTPAKTSGAEEFVKLPIVSNTFGRFFRVSDYGVTEQLNQVKENVQTARARVLIENNKLVNKYINQALETDSPQERKAMEKELVKERFNGEPKSEADITEARNIVTKFRVGLTKSISGPEVDSLATASTNEEKTAILKNIQTRMTPEEFKKLQEVAIKERLVSAEVFGKLNKNK